MKCAGGDERFWSKVGGGGVDTCWLWCAATNNHGYGKYGKAYAHRYAYEALRAEIPDGLVLDHLCRNRGCVNPWHLEPVTQRVNLLRGASWAGVCAAKTHCPRGHAYDGTNTYRTPRGARNCKTCRRAALIRWRALRAA